MKKPLVILSEPYEQEIKTTIGTYRKCVVLHTNYGPLKVSEASRILGIVAGTLRTRIRRLGWNHPDVVTPGEITRPLPGTKEAKEKASKTESPIYKNLSTKVRTKNLGKIKELGTWELKQLRGEK